MTEKDEIKRLEARLDALAKVRRPHETRMEDSIRYILPYHHTMNPRASLADWEDERFDSTATEAATMLADGMMGNICPPTVKWFAHRTSDNDLNDDPDVRMWLQEVDERMHEAVNRSNFYDIAPTIFKHGVSIETVSCPVDADPETGLAVLSVLPPREVYVVNDAYGQVRAVFRSFKLTADAAWGLFRESRDKFSVPLRRAAEKTPEEEFPFVSVYEKRIDRDPKKDDAANMPWRGRTFEAGGAQILEDSGYRSIPIPTWRWEVRGRDAYGYGLSTEAMADIKMVNEMARTILVMAQKIADPPTFLPNEFANQNEVSLEPGAINFYRDPGMRPYIHLPSTGFPVNEKILESYREKIRSIFKVRYFLMLMQMEQAGRTAYEIRERKIEKITAMGSIVGRCQQELLIPILARFFWIEFDAGRLPLPPKKLSGKALTIDFVGPFAQAQKEVTQTSGVLNGLNNVLGLFNVWPHLSLKFNEEQVVEELLLPSGFPQKALRSKEEFETLVQQQQQAAAQREQAQQQIEILKAGRVPSGSIASQIMEGEGV